MVKSMVLFILLASLISCYQIKHLGQSRIIILKKSEKPFKGLPFQKISNVLVESSVSTLNDTIGINLVVDTFTIKKFNFNLEQSLYEEYIKNIISNEQFEDYISLFNIDTTKLVKVPSKTLLKFYIGVVKTLGFWIICDMNNNNNFSDEIKYFVTYAKSNSLDSLPIFYTNRMIYYFDSTKRNAEYYFKIQPYIRFKKDTILNKSDIAEIGARLITTNVKYGKLRIGLSKYKIYALQMNTKIIYDTKSTIFGIIYNHKKRYDYKFKPLSVSLPFIVRKRLFVIDSLSPFGESIKVKYIGKYKKTDFNPIIDSPLIFNFQTNTTNSLKDYLGKKKYLIINFWGTWCKPCISELALVKKFYSSLDSSKYSVLSIAYDTWDKITNIKSLVELDSLNWQQGLVDRAKNNNLIDLLRIYSFPTFLIIDAKGKPIAREIGEDGIEKIKFLLLKHNNIK